MKLDESWGDKRDIKAGTQEGLQEGREGSEIINKSIKNFKKVLYFLSK